RRRAPREAALLEGIGVDDRLVVSLEERLVVPARNGRRGRRLAIAAAPRRDGLDHARAARLDEADAEDHDQERRHGRERDLASPPAVVTSFGSSAGSSRIRSIAMRSPRSSGAFFTRASQCASLSLSVSSRSEAARQRSIVGCATYDQSPTEDTIAAVTAARTF